MLLVSSLFYDKYLFRKKTLFSVPPCLCGEKIYLNTLIPLTLQRYEGNARYFPSTQRFYMCKTHISVYAPAPGIVTLYDTN